MTSHEIELLSWGELLGWLTLAVCSGWGPFLVLSLATQRREKRIQGQLKTESAANRDDAPKGPVYQIIVLFFAAVFFGAAAGSGVIAVLVLIRIIDGVQ